MLQNPTEFVRNYNIERKGDEEISLEFSSWNVLILKKYSLSVFKDTFNCHVSPLRL